MEEPIHAAGVLVFNCADDEILSVSRGANEADRGLPAGKLNEGERPLEAALRELEEETGVKLGPYDMGDESFICEGNSGREVQTYVARICKQTPTQSSREGSVRWVGPDVVKAGSFGAYNIALLESFSKLDAPLPTCKCGK